MDADKVFTGRATLLEMNREIEQIKADMAELKAKKAVKTTVAVKRKTT